MIKLLKRKLIRKHEEISAPSFFDYKAEEKKRIVKKAARESNKMQLDLVKKYRRMYSV